MALNWNNGQLAEGLRLYEAGEFFAAHEAWESVWLAADGMEKRLLQGVIQVAAAFHHYHRNNPQGTVLLLQAALRRLESCRDGIARISVGQLCVEIEMALRELESGEDVRAPKIEVL